MMGTQPVYELVDSTAGNTLGAYETEDAAMAIVSASWDKSGPEAVETLSLVYWNSNGDIQKVMSGGDLLHRVKKALSA